jgi:DNA-binding protein H-NS
MNIFDEIYSRLSSKARIRSLFKDVHVEDLEKLIKRLVDISNEKKEMKKKHEEQKLLKQNNIEVIKKIMEEKGVSLNDLGMLDFKDISKKRKKLQKYTFEYETFSGAKTKWTGATTGRLPRDFQDYLDRTGKKRLDCVKNKT